MKFKVYLETGNEFCTQCGRQMQEPYLQLEQNRWAKPKLCKECIKELLRQIETGELPNDEKKKVIVLKERTITNNGWMCNF